MRFLKRIRFATLLPQVGALSLLALLVFSLPGSAQASALNCGANVGCMFVGGIMDFAGKLFATFFFVGVQLFGILLGWIGAFFNTAAIVTVFQFSRYFGNSEGLLLAWGILRDLANITLLFGFVFIGVATILGIQKYAATKALPTLIMFAVLLNFSLFITEATIDISNAIGASFFSQAGGTECGFDFDFEQCAGQGISGQIMATAGISSIFDGGAWMENFDNIINADNGIAAAILYLGILALIIVLTGVMFAGAIILVSRAVTLMLVMVTSPIGFAGMAVPGLNKIASKWWDSLIKNVIFAPVFILLTLVGLKISEGARNSLVGEGFSVATMLSSGEPAGIGTVFVMFALIVGFFWGALMFAEKSGVLGAKMVSSNAQKWAANTGGGYALWPVNRASRIVGGGYEKVARGISRVPLVGGLATGALVATGIDGGIRGMAKAGTNLKIPMQTKTYLERGEASAKRMKEIGTEAKNEKKLADKKKELETAINTAVSSNGKDTDKLELAVKDMSIAELKETKQIKEGARGVEQMANVMTTSTFKKVMEDPDVRDDVKEKMRKARYEDKNTGSLADQVRILNDRTATSKEVGEAKTKLGKWSAEDFELSGMLKDETKLAAAVRVMGDDQFDALQKADIGRNLKTRLDSLRHDPSNKDGRFGPNHVEHTLTKVITKSSDRAKLRGNVLTSDQVLSRLSPNDFAEIQKANKLEPSERQKMRDFMNDPANAWTKMVITAYRDQNITNANAKSNFTDFYGL